MADRFDAGWAWQPYRPSDDNPWDVRKVGHLYRRAAFGADWEQLQAGVTAGPDALITQLLDDGGLAEFDERMKPLADQALKAGAETVECGQGATVTSPPPKQPRSTAAFHAPRIRWGYTSILTGSSISVLNAFRSSAPTAPSTTR